MRTSTDFWWSALISPLSVRCGIALVVVLLALVVIVRAMVRVGRPQRSRVPLWRDQGGVVTIEFALLLPILLFSF